MSSYEQALRHTLEFEAGYANNPADNGGETYRGVSRNNWPKWPGWAKIDHAKRLGIISKAGLDREFANDPEMEAAVAAFYKAEFWDKVPESFPPQLKAKTFDTCVNMGLSGGFRILQRALNKTGEHLKVDGICGKLTTAAAVKATQGLLMDMFCLCQKQKYQSIVRNDRTGKQARFLNGWLRRAAWKPEA
jgi:lysozyme family protein